MKYEQIMIPGTETRRNAQSRTTAAKLRERIATEGFHNMEDSEILTAIIGFVNQTEEAPEIAERLLDAFGSLKGVLEARPEMLRNVRGVGAKMSFLISSVVPMVRIWERVNHETRNRIGNSRDAESYCKSLLAGRRTEGFYVIALSAKCEVLGVRQISEGSLSEVSAYPRTVIETALNYNAHSVLLTHNHPGGTCAPSPEDIASTHQLQRLLSGIGILVLDHIIIAKDSAYSMIQHGDIDFRTRT